MVYGATKHVFIAFFWRTMLFLLLWLAANYSYSQSLGHMSASATSTIMSTNTAMVCILGIAILHDRFIPFRVRYLLYSQISDLEKVAQFQKKISVLMLNAWLKKLYQNKS